MVSLLHIFLLCLKCVKILCSVLIHCILPPWRWPNDWPTHVAGHCLYRLISRYLFAFVGTSVCISIEYIYIYIYIYIHTYHTSPDSAQGIVQVPLVLTWRNVDAAYDAIQHRPLTSSYRRRYYIWLSKCDATKKSRRKPHAKPYFVLQTSPLAALK